MVLTLLQVLNPEGASGSLRCLESGHSFVEKCSSLGTGFIGFIKVSQRAVIKKKKKKKESLKGKNRKAKIKQV